jgi:hypothetical protein
MKQKILLVIALVAFTSIGLNSIVHRDNKIEFQKVELQSKRAEIKQLQIEYKTLDKKQTEVQQKNNASQKDIENLQKEKDDLLKRQKELEQQVTAKRAADAIAANKLQQAASSVSVSATATASAASLPDNSYKAYIYQHESGNNPNAVNSIGCRGLGQACPGSKLPCGSDYACQDAWFTNYALTRYGSWEAAYGWWVQNHWW